MSRPDVYLCTDAEADGPTPGPCSMLSLGVAVAGTFDGERFVGRRCTPSCSYAGGGS